MYYTINSSVDEAAIIEYMIQTYRLYEYFLPRHYDLALTLEREARQFYGSVTIHGHKPHRAHPILFHAKDLTLSHVTVDGELASITPLAHDAYRIEADVESGEHSIYIEFSGSITDAMHGIYPCYYEHDGEKKELLATQFESHHAREAFPCIDEPEAKATFDLTLVTEPDVTVLSNMPILKSIRQLADQNLTSTTFQTTQRMSTYLLAFVVGNLHASTAKSKNGTEISVYSTQPQVKSTHQFALGEAVRLLDFYEDYFGVPYPLPKCDHVALPDFSALAMENWGLITYREGYLLATDMTPIDQQRYIATVIAHELAHQWFGNLVTMRWWDDLWLNESFANVMEYIALDHVHPDWRVWDDFAAKESVLALSRDQFSSIQPVAYHVRTPDDIAAVFDKAILYCKGSRLIRMAIAYIGEDAFRQALTQYFTDFAYGNTDGHDLWRAMHTSSGKHIEALMEHWLTHSGLPMVSVIHTNGTYRLHQERLRVGRESEGTIWPIPLAAADRHFPELLHDKTYSDIAADSPQLNRDGVSHFLTHYDVASYESMCQRVQNGSLTNVERCLLLYETYILTQSGHYTPVHLFDLLQLYRQETSSAVWLIIAEVLDGLELITESFVTPDNFARYALTILSNAAAHYPIVGFAPHDENERATHGIVNKLLVRYRHNETVAAALQLYRDAERLDQLDGNIQPALFLAASRHGNKADMTRLVHLHMTTHDAHLRDLAARALSSSDDGAVLTSWVDALTDAETIKLQDVPIWFYCLMRNPQSREATWRWLRDNWAWVMATFGNGHALEKFPMYGARALYGKPWARQYRDFFASHDDPTIRRVVQVGLDEITARSEWIERDQVSIAAYIER